MSEKPKQSRKRSFPVKPQALLLLEKTMREKGFTYSTQEQMYEELWERTGRTISIDTVKNFFNPQFGHHPQRNTIQALATTLGLMPEDLVEGWATSTVSKAASLNTSAITIDPSTFQRMLDKKIRESTANIFLSGNLKSAKLYVPLGLIERKEKSRHGEVKPEHGSVLYRANEYEISREFENDQFLTEVLLQGNSPKSSGRRIAIIGEPGSGKSTRLRQISMWLMEQSSENYVIWISLADLRGYSLEDYLLNKWLKETLNQRDTSEDAQDKLVKIFNQGNVWLLLDGIDEMGLSGNPLAWVNNQIRGWIDQAKIIVTCRINVWDGNRQALNQFDVYRNLDFFDDQRNLFIVKFLDNPELSGGLIDELGKPGKERISDLAKNPLRLTLICRSWQKRQGKLPDTKAGLYQECVDAYYDWKEEPKTTKAQRKKLNKALGELAKQALDRDDFRFRLTEAQITEVLGESDEGLFKLALDVGWLNEIGKAKENYQKIYAFFHPSFQEYFAALAIDKSEFLLNHIPDNPQKGVYRIFESQWIEVTLLWIGLPSVNDDQKNKLINQLVYFNYEPKSAYIYQIRALIIATELISEFHDCEIVDTILDCAISYAFGDWDQKNQELIEYPKNQDFRNKIKACSHPKLLKKIEDKLVLLSENVPNCSLFDLAAIILDKNPDNTIAQKIVNHYSTRFPDRNYTIDDYYRHLGFKNYEGFVNTLSRMYEGDYGSDLFWQCYEQNKNKLKVTKFEDSNNIKGFLKNSLNFVFTDNNKNIFQDNNEAKDITELVGDYEWVWLNKNSLDNQFVIDLFVDNPSYLFSSSGLVLFLDNAIVEKNGLLINIIENNITDFDSDQSYAFNIENAFLQCLDNITNWMDYVLSCDTANDLINQTLEYDYFRYKNPESTLSMDLYYDKLRQSIIKKEYGEVPGNIFKIGIKTTNINIFLAIFDFIVDLTKYYDYLISYRLMDEMLLKSFSFNGDYYLPVKIVDYFANRINYSEFHKRWFNYRFSDQLPDRQYLNRQVSNQSFFLSIKTENLNSITSEIKLLKRFKRRFLQSIPAEIKPQLQALINSQYQTVDINSDDLIDQIEEIILAIRDELQVDEFNLFLDNKNPSQLLLDLRDQFSDLVNIEWNR
ncbi:NACHT domain-containing NTPase [Synechocystis sp. PCC 7338]|uniref:NACHT domain-containing protein n=1 Tax=Synechocystis sp. PCC 7338 TaxID=2732530 RepID=UPI001BAF1B06|nr:NACHT domain-containing protein [Synechocystis sp. PCC 7338]QUS60353.1 NACHT domain-containing protein [Synechocystis sp. PCC 7338]